jgi:hypothetical protein
VSISYKFGAIDPAGSETEYCYANCWTEETTTGPTRLLIAPASRQADLLFQLSGCFTGPYWLLYLLLVSRIGKRPGRYQISAPVPRAELKLFLDQYREFLENDARHHLWIAGPQSTGLLVYDNHNVIYGYGPLACYKNVLTAAGLKGEEEIRYPVPHAHKYNAEFDAQEEVLLQEYEWRYSPLQESDKQ